LLAPLTVTERHRCGQLIFQQCHILQAAREHGFALSELLGDMHARRRKPARAKYAHSENAAVTWTGRGRKPKWVAEHLAKGRTLDDLAV
jgi:DNA-binding protein H-NS